MSSVSRRRFLRGGFSPAAAALRPPWAVTGDAFIDACSRCDACLTACPTRVIVRGDGGFPQVDFTRGECTFCGACVAACEPGALRRAAGAPWQLALAIADTCLARANVVCRTCGDVCEPRALSFVPQLGRVAVPQVDASACTGCGACVSVCPKSAVSLSVQAEREAVPA